MTLTDDTDSISVLCVDDEPGLAELICTHLERTAEQFSATAVTNARRALELLDADDATFDCVVSDYDMPRTDGLEFLETVRAERPGFPFVLLTGRGSGEIAREAIAAGATDYMQKGSRTDQYHVLAHRLENAVARHRLQRDAEAAHDRRETPPGSPPPRVHASRGRDEEYVVPTAAPLSVDADGRAGRPLRGVNDASEVVEILVRLYQLSSDTGEDFEANADAVLELGAEYLGLPYGFVARTADDRQTITAATGGHELLQPPESYPIRESYCRETIETESGLLAVQNAIADGWGDDAAYRRFELGAYIGARVVANGELYGTLCFAAREPLPRAFSEMERTFVVLLSQWLSAELEQREYKSELEAKNAELDRFATNLSHDLRNSLNVAIGHLELATRECDSEHLSLVNRAHSRMRDLIDNTLALARAGKQIDDVAEVDLAALADSCWAYVETGDASVSVRTERAVLADEARLARLFENLFRNAVEHGGDDVSVVLGDLPGGFYVEDTGVGIPEHERANVFEAGYSSKTGGTGIGLHVVDLLATAHDWDVDVTAGAEGGARFEFTGVERP